MLIRQAEEKDVFDIKDLYFNFLTQYPPKEEQDIEVWKKLINEMNRSENLYLLVVEEDNRVVSTVQLAIIPSLTHNVRSFAVVENVVTHEDYRKKGFASMLLQEAIKIAQNKNCYKIFLETGSNRETTLNFYKENGFEKDTKHSFLKKL
ncbi:Ribosomal protein S18 acetylase RimI [Treponema bryantii]|uniref:Ribosomal protein S18 acetylase RimI n=1 Tax=Treponema bryantii TaxID=163 RepID=A0A1H9CZB7_9SPIR|nr:GNAT family N-acetyltransferase [Treponema bryantii]SEQ06545.1 Ribosomal protein S18 acetylase RimI [Treponema bryantii]